MKILQIIASCDRAEGGPVEGAFVLSEAFRALEHEHELLTLDLHGSPAVQGSPIKVHALGQPLPPGNLPWNKIRRWARFSPEGVEWLRRHVRDYDAVIVDGLWNYSTRMARLALPDAGVPYVVFPHGMLDPWFRRRYPLKHMAKSALWRFNEGPLLRHAGAVLFTSNMERDLARKAWHPWGLREVIVGYGTAAPPARTKDMDAAFAAQVPGLAGRPYLLFMSRIHEKKNCEGLIGAFADVCAECDFDLVMAGTGDADYVANLRNLARSIAPDSRIHWPGMLSGDAKWGALHGCTAMALASHQENFGVVVAESLGCGRPVIISDQINICDQVAAAGAGLICTTDRRSIARAIAEFIGLTQQQQGAMGQRGRGLFAASFNIASVASRLITILGKAGAPRQGAE